ncbi:hypothetical protein HanRHA438_Chr08g0354701 [Helianthus annuus]|nr:hypothetical protein HanIR_Chr08g0370551 [Helianthus annuus]KAJ0898248.1 hypothetical protein HanRHA438_Chr08g0354701 [Helianthus annuus]
MVCHKIPIRVFTQIVFGDYLLGLEFLKEKLPLVMTIIPLVLNYFNIFCVLILV